MAEQDLSRYVCQSSVNQVRSSRLAPVNERAGIVGDPAHVTYVSTLLM